MIYNYHRNYYRVPRERRGHFHLAMSWWIVLEETNNPTCYHWRGEIVRNNPTHDPLDIAF